MKNQNEIKGLTIPEEIIEQANLGDMITLSATNGVIVLKKTDMTALDVVSTISAIDKLAIQLYDVLLTNFSKDDDCGCCNFCDKNMEENVTVPEWALEKVGLPSDTKLRILALEDSERIILEPAEYDNDIEDIDDDMLERLSDVGICLKELNESIKRDEVIYSE